MNIQKSAPASFAPGQRTGLLPAVADNISLLAVDAVDLGCGIGNVMNLSTTQGAKFLNGASYVLGAYHAIQGIKHFALSGDGVIGPNYDAKYHSARATGELLTATGHFCAAAGVGAASLAFLGLGVAVTTLTEL